MYLVLVDNLIMPQEGSLARLDVHPHLGLLALATAAEVEGHRVEILDPKRSIEWGELPFDATLYERAASEILSRDPDAVGFTALGCSFLFALRVAAVIKRAQPDTPVLLGGPHATMLHRQIMEQFPQIDVIVRHEADEIFPGVLDALERRAFDPIPGVSWRASDGRPAVRFTEGRPKVADLDSLPIVSYDYYPVAELGLDLLRVEAGRGCPFHCTFCSTAGFFQRAYRLKSADRLVRELDLLHARYGFSDFKLDHDMFTVNRRKVREFCEAVEGRGYRWRASARVDCVDEDLLSAMAAAGCVNLYFGIETGSRRMQQICEKRLKLELVHPILDAAERLGIETTASFIAGYPEELPADQEATLDLLGRCFRRACLPQLHMLAPEPGTPMFDRLGATIEYDGYWGRYNARFVSDDDERLVLDHPDIFQTYYYYPAAMPRAHHVHAVEAVDVLRRLGPIVVRYLLRAFGGRLSTLVAELRAFAESCGWGGPPDARLLEQYVAERFGRHHHVTSLVRFALRATGEAGPPARDRGVASPPRFDPGAPYRLHPGVHVLSDLHDCAMLLERIEGEPERPNLLNESEAGESGVYLLRVEGEGVAACRIDSGVEAVLELFWQARTCREVAELVCEAAGLPEMPLGFFERLAESGILERAGD